MNIRKADSAGFCFGVNRAINMVNDLIDQNEKVCTLGPIIHNMEVVRELNDRGCRPVERIDDVHPDEILVIRSHGVPKSVITSLGEKKLRFRDATCPFVKKIHHIVAETKPEFEVVLIAGNAIHPEVQGIIGNCTTDCFTFNNGKELDNVLADIQKKNYNLKCKFSPYLNSYFEYYLYKIYHFLTYFQ